MADKSRLRSLVSERYTQLSDHRLVEILRQRGFDGLEPAVALELVYQVMFGHGPDEGAYSQMLPALEAGHMSNHDLLRLASTWPEASNQPAFPVHQAHLSLHNSRRQWIRMLPRAATIVDLGGVDLGNPVGALVALGYPYRFDSLTIVDLPSAERHPDYRSPEIDGTVPSPLGPVTYLYRSMTDLDGLADASVDLVYSGQSFEHVTTDDGVRVLDEVKRVLRPGGKLALDTPNAALTRLQQDEFIDPDHEHEYTLDELVGVVEAGGLIVRATLGLNYAGQSAASRTFNMAEVAANCGVYAAADQCYILAVLAEKP